MAGIHLQWVAPIAVGRHENIIHWQKKRAKNPVLQTMAEFVEPQVGSRGNSVEDAIAQGERADAHFFAHQFSRSAIHVELYHPSRMPAGLGGVGNTKNKPEQRVWAGPDASTQSKQTAGEAVGRL